MKVDRSVTALPFRTAEGTWRVLASFLAEVMESRQFAHMHALTSALADLRQFAVLLVTRHAIESGYVMLEMGDLQVKVAVQYGGDRADENLTMPPVAALRPLATDAHLSLTFHTGSMLTASDTSGFSLPACQMIAISVVPAVPASIDPGDQKGDCHGSRNGDES